MIATTSHAIRKPSAPTIMTQGTNTSENLSSGRFSAPAKRLTNCDLPTINIVRFLPELRYETYFRPPAVGRAQDFGELSRAVEAATVLAVASSPICFSGSRFEHSLPAMSHCEPLTANC